MTVGEVEEIFSGFSRVRAGAGIVLRGIENRAALGALELRELGERAIVAAALIAIAVAFLFFAAVTVTVVVAAIFWDTPHRVTALAVFGGLELAVAVGLALWVRNRWVHFAPFAATREQFEKDRACLHDLLP